MKPADRMRSPVDASLGGRRSREMNRIQLYSNSQLEARIRRLQATLSQPNDTGPQRDQLEERLALLRLELETRAGV